MEAESTVLSFPFALRNDVSEVAYADNILDENMGKDQQTINAEVQSQLDSLITTKYEMTVNPNVKNYDNISQVDTEVGQQLTLNLTKTRLKDKTYPFAVVTLRKYSATYKAPKTTQDTDYGAKGVVDSDTVENMSYKLDYGNIDYGVHQYKFTASTDGTNVTGVFTINILKPFYWWMAYTEDATVEIEATERCGKFERMTRVDACSFDGDKVTLDGTHKYYIYMALPEGFEASNVTCQDAMGKKTQNMKKVTTSPVQVGDDATNLYNIFRTETADLQSVSGIKVTYNGSKFE